jgi:hypothetical protein
VVGFSIDVKLHGYLYLLFRRLSDTFRSLVFGLAGIGILRIANPDMTEIVAVCPTSILELGCTDNSASAKMGGRVPLQANMFSNVTIAKITMFFISIDSS